MTLDTNKKMNKRRSLSMDRMFAIILSIGSIFIALDIRYELTGNHSLWTLSLVSSVIWPVGFVIVAFWVLSSFTIFSIKIRYIGWVIAAIWHFGWLAYLLITVFGLMVFISTAPFLFAWMIFAGCMCVAASVKIDDYEREKLV